MFLLETWALSALPYVIPVQRQIFSPSPLDCRLAAMAECGERCPIKSGVLGRDAPCCLVRSFSASSLLAGLSRS